MDREYSKGEAEEGRAYSPAVRGTGGTAIHLAGVILYGDDNNWFAAWACWQLKMYGYRDVKLMNGGRAKWAADNRPLTTDVPPSP